MGVTLDIRHFIECVHTIGLNLNLAGLFLRSERGSDMKFGKDFFKILNLVIQIMRLFAKVFGDEDDKTGAVESEARTASDKPYEAC